MWIFSLNRPLGSVLVLFSLICIVAAQFPEECLKNKGHKCCPSSFGQECGGPTRGACTPMDQATSAYDYIPPQLSDLWTHICVCVGDFSGSRCNMCRPGMNGSRCDRPFNRPRKSWPLLETVEQNAFVTANLRMKAEIIPDFQPLEYNGTLYTVYDTLVLAVRWAHVQTRSIHATLGLNFAEGGPGFSTWLRYLLLQYEHKLYHFGYPTHLAMPFWHWPSIEDGRWIYQHDSPFGPMNGVVNSGSFSNWTIVGDDWYGDTSGPSDCPYPDPKQYGKKLFRSLNSCGALLPSSQTVHGLFKKLKYDCLPFNKSANGPECFRNAFEQVVLQMRRVVGGIMLIGPLAANDPIFWLLMAEADYIFESWMELNANSRAQKNFFPVTKTADGMGLADVVAPFFPFMIHDDFFRSSNLLGYTYQVPLPVLPPIQMDDPDRDPTLTFIQNGYPGSGSNNCTSTTVIVGCGISGLVTAYELIRAGCKAIILEMTDFCGVGPVADPNYEFSGTASDVPWIEPGSYGIPCSHWSVFAYAHKFNVPMRTMKVQNPQAMLLLQCFDDQPIPYRVLQTNLDVWDKIYECFNITESSERQPTFALLGNAFYPLLQRLAHLTSPEARHATFVSIMNAEQGKSLKEYLKTDARLSDEAISMISVVENLNDLMYSSVIEFFLSIAGKWNDDNITCSYPTGPLYAGQKSAGIWEFTEGLQGLVSGFMKVVKPHVRFGQRVNSITYTANNTAIVSYSNVRRSNAVFQVEGDFVVLAVPSTVVLGISMFPPLPSRLADVLKDTRFRVTVTALVQIRDANYVSRPSPMVDPLYNQVGILNGTGGTSASPQTMLNKVHYPTHPTDESRVFLVLSSSGESASLIAGLPDDVQSNYAISLLKKLHGNEVEEKYELVVAKGWGTSSSHFHGVPVFLPGQLSSLPTLQSPFGRIYFAGDTYSVHRGLLIGDIDSGIRAAKDILKESLDTVLVSRYNANFPNTTTLPLDRNGNPQFCSTYLRATTIFLESGSTKTLPAESYERSVTVMSGKVEMTVRGITEQRAADGSTHLATVPAGAVVTYSPINGSAQVVETTPAPPEGCQLFLDKMAFRKTDQTNSVIDLEVVDSITQIYEGQSDSSKPLKQLTTTGYYAGMGIGSTNSNHQDEAGILMVAGGVAYAKDTRPGSSQYKIETSPDTFYAQQLSGIKPGPIPSYQASLKSPENGPFVIENVPMSTLWPAAYNFNAHKGEAVSFTGYGFFSKVSGDYLKKAPKTNEPIYTHKGYSAEYYGTGKSYSNRYVAIHGYIGSKEHMNHGTFLNAQKFLPLYSWANDDNTTTHNYAMVLILKDGQTINDYNDVRPEQVEDLLILSEDSRAVRLELKFYTVKGVDEPPSPAPPAKKSKEKLYLGLFIAASVLAALLLGFVLFGLAKRYNWCLNGRRSERGEKVEGERVEESAPLISGSSNREEK